MYLAIADAVVSSRSTISVFPSVPFSADTRVLVELSAGPGTKTWPILLGTTGRIESRKKNSRT